MISLELIIALSDGAEDKLVEGCTPRLADESIGSLFELDPIEKP